MVVLDTHAHADTNTHADIDIDESALGRLGTALADRTRRQILLALLDGPAYPAELATRLGLTRANTSNHLSCLRGCGLVQTSAEGRRVRYEVADPNLAAGLQLLTRAVLANDPSCTHGR